MMFKKHQIAIVISTLFSINYATASEPVSLEPIQVTESANKPTIDRKYITQHQPQDLKALLAYELDVQVNDLQRTRSGNDGINIRGLQGNRVASSIDGIPLPETQENKLMTSLGMDFGGLNNIEPTALRSASIQYNGSYQGLSSSVDFSTLEPRDLIHSGNTGGFIATGYDSVDKSTYGSLAGAVKNEKYEGLALATLRFGHETKNKGTVGGEGATRTKADPADYKNHYVLVKNAFQANEENRIKLTVEHYQKSTDTELASSNGVNIDRATGIQSSGSTSDESRRTRVSLGHEYQSQQGFINSVKTQVYFQNALNKNYRKRNSLSASRIETGETKQKSYGIASQFSTFIDSQVPQILNYGLAYHQTDFSADLACNRCSSSLSFDPMAKTKQHKAHLYLEDEITLSNVVITPHLGVLHYHLKPSKTGYTQAAEEYARVEAQKQTVFLPKFTLQWKMRPLFEPYFQYSRGVKTPSAQQLTSSFGNSGRYYSYAVVGNPQLKAETADNFSLGLKGQNESLQYDIAGYYNKYHHFIDWVSRQTTAYNPLIQYQNMDNAKIYGVTARAKWYFIDSLYLSSGLAYAKGKAENNGKKVPINTIQPLKLKVGLGYEGEQFGGNVQLTHIRAKADKDILGDIYNPTQSVNLVDLGIYWKPIKNLTLSANVNNVFDKKYWNWADISYFAVQNSSAATGGPNSSGISASNADAYSAPGRHFNLGLRYEF